ncbi:hypothetical protein RFI_16290, partial [Reticulomyxa filosa]
SKRRTNPTNADTKERSTSLRVYIIITKIYIYTYIMSIFAHNLDSRGRVNARNTAVSNLLFSNEDEKEFDPFVAMTGNKEGNFHEQLQQVLEDHECGKGISHPSDKLNSFVDLTSDVVDLQSSDENDSEDVTKDVTESLRADLERYILPLKSMEDIIDIEDEGSSLPPPPLPPLPPLPNKDDEKRELNENVNNTNKPNLISDNQLTYPHFDNGGELHLRKRTFSSASFNGNVSAIDEPPLK